MIASTSEKKTRKRSFRYHPVTIFTYLILVGIISIFLTLTLAYTFTTYGTEFNRFDLPLLFHANSVIILMSSYSMHQAKLANIQDNASSYTNGILITAMLGVVFTTFQIVAWNELLHNGISMQKNIAGAYLYIISGLHLIHILAGVALLFYFWLKAKERENNPVAVLLFDTNPVEKLKVKNLALYWHFVDGLWLYLYLFFMLNIFIAKHNVHV